MAIKNYSYPRVTMKTFAKKHSNNVVTVPDTTILFAPLVTEKGPDDRLVKVHSLSEFANIFGDIIGSEEFYDLNGQMAHNVFNWLNNGGTLITKRLVLDKTEKATANVKNLQLYYNDTSVGSVKITGNKITEIELDKKYMIYFKKDINTKEFISYTIREHKTVNELNQGESIMPGELVLGDKGDKVIHVTDKDTSRKYHYTYYLEDGSPVSREIVITKKDPSSETEVTISELFIELLNMDGNTTLLGYTCNNDDGISIYYQRAEAGADDTYNNFEKIEAKYYGSYYGNIELKIDVKEVNSEKYFNFTFYEVQKNRSKIAVEQHLQKTLKTFKASLSASNYIDINSLDILERQLDKIDGTETFVFNCPEALKSYSDTLAKIEEFWTGKCSNSDHFDSESKHNDSAHPDCKSDNIDSYKKYLLNKLESPIDIILDAGYPKEIKDVLLSVISNDIDNEDTVVRPDIVLILDEYSLNDNLRLGKPTENMMHDASKSNRIGNNTAIYNQYFLVHDDDFANQDIYVTPTYFLSKLIPHNDNTYGIQYPTAGLNRGVLENVLWLNKNPDAEQKETWFQDRTNYVEKTSREIAFMAQRTHDGSNDFDYTALSFLNNVRVLERMKKDLESMARSYLYEFNDAITLANMTTALNKYVSTWISNRTLSMGMVEVVQNAASENALDINLTIKFTNTIEVIHVSIVIE